VPYGNILFSFISPTLRLSGREPGERYAEAGGSPDHS